MRSARLAAGWTQEELASLISGYGSFTPHDVESWESGETEFPSWVMSVFKGSAPTWHRERPGFVSPTLAILGILVMVAGLSVLRVLLSPGIDAGGDGTPDKFTWSGPFIVAVSALLVLAAIANWWAVVLLIRNFRRSIRRRRLGMWFQNFVILAVCSTFLGLVALNCLLGAPLIAPRPGGPLPVGLNYFFMLMCSLIPPVPGILFLVRFYFR
ncbi:MAG: hypothetical protein LBJ87_07250 [bacterium]|nr:hypothetical protein [bacterium]